MIFFLLYVIYLQTCPDVWDLDLAVALNADMAFAQLRYPLVG